MPLYALTAEGPDGTVRARRVLAPDESRARELLRLLGWKARPATPATEAPPPPRGAEPAAAIDGAPRRRVLQVLLWVGLVAVQVFVWRVTDSGCVSGIVAGLFVLVLFVLNAPSTDRMRLYDALVAVHGATRPEEVLDLGRRVLEAPGEPPSALLRSDVDWRVASALWMLGRDDEAEERVRPYRRLEGGAPEKSYWARRGGALLAARRDDEGLGSLERALAVTPRTRTDLLDLALALGRRRRGTEARALLEEARRSRGNVVSWALGPLVEALVLLEEGHADEALRSLRRVRRRIRWLPIGALRSSVQTELSAYACLAFAASGRRPEAAAELARARPRLEESGDLALLVRCEEALASVGGS